MPGVAGVDLVLDGSESVDEDNIAELPLRCGSIVTLGQPIMRAGRSPQSKLCLSQRFFEFGFTVNLNFARSVKYH